MCRNFLSGVLEFVGGFGGGIETGSVRSEFGLGFLFCCFNVIGYFFSVCFVVVRKYVGVGHADGLDSEDSLHLLFVDEVWITEFFKPVEVVEDGMIDTVVSG